MTELDSFLYKAHMPWLGMLPQLSQRFVRVISTTLSKFYSPGPSIPSSRDLSGGNCRHIAGPFWPSGMLELHASHSPG
jgi:hypothetical protein